MRPATADMVFIFCNICQLQEVAEGANYGLRSIARKRVKQGSEFGPGVFAVVAITGKADGSLPYTLDNFEN
jgi:hypothetical protein